LTLGSDYPVGEADPVGFVTRCSDIGNAEKRMILSGKAAELFGIVGQKCLTFKEKGVPPEKIARNFNRLV
jgi:hypothetical protein